MKDPDSRWQSAADVARQLRWISSVRQHLGSATHRAAASAMA